MHTFPAALLFFLAVPAQAHFSLTYPPARYSDQLQGAPCGRSPETGRDHVTTLHSGAELVVTWDQTISNQGYLRVGFDDDGEDVFVNPTWYTGDYYAGPWVLQDNIPITPLVGTTTVTLPNIECQNCTLQVIEVLSDHVPPWGDGDDFHYQCADLVLVDDTVFADSFDCAGNQCAETLLISQVQTRGENGSGDEFVELYNPTNVAVMFDATWTLWARSSSSFTYSLRLTGASQLIQPHRHILYTGMSYNASVAGDASLSVGITDATSLILRHNDDVVDAVCFYYNATTQQVFSTDYTCEGPPTSNLPHNDTIAGNTDASISRKPGGANGNAQDTDDNTADFYSNPTPDPHNLASPPVP